MKLKERINNIKELLSYCDHEEISIRDDKSRKFLYKFFTEHNEFENPYHWYHDENEHDKIAEVEIHLYTAYLNKDKIYPLRISYMTHHNFDDEDWVGYMFDDEDVTYEYEWMKPKNNLKYSDFPDWLWEKLQNKIYVEVKEILRKKMESARDYYLKDLARLNYEEKLMTYNDIVEKYEQSIN